MKIVYNDGSVLTCSHIEVFGNIKEILADGIYSVNIEEIESIEED